MYVISDVG